MATAAAVSEAFWPAAEDAILATAGNYPDALAAGTLASSLGAPLLLTGTDALAPTAAAELRRLGVERVHVMGGTAAVSDAVEGELREAGYAVARIAGDGRFSTAAAVARQAGAAASGDLVLALGEHVDPARAWPDALSAGGLAATADRPPLLLSGGQSLPQATEEALAELSGGEDRRVLLVGGTAAIGEPVEAQLVEAGHTVVRLSGTSRYETSTRVAEAVLRRMPLAPRPLVIASGANFPDGLAAAALAARIDGVLVLVPPEALDAAPTLRPWLTAMGPRFSEVIVVGGVAAVSDGTAADVAEALAQPIAPLPAPLPIPAGTPPEVARQLVEAIVSVSTPLGEDTPAGSAGALLTALSQAGFTVLQSNGSVVAGPSGGVDMGLAFDAWEVAGLADIATMQQADDLTAFAADIAGINDLLDGAPLADFLLDGVRQAAANASHPAHLWAWLIVEAGRQAPTPHDVLTDPPAAVQLTQLQHALILRRLAGDLLWWAQQEQQRLDSRDRALTAATPRQAAPGTARPCNLNGTAGMIIDNVAVAASTAFGGLLQFIENAGVPGVDKLNKGLGVAGVVSTIGQLVVSYVAQKATISLETPGPIVRTPDEDPGEHHTLVTTIKMDIGNAQVINCFRFLLNAVGLDFAVPQDGPLPGVLVNTPFLYRDLRYGLEGRSSRFPHGPESFQNKITDEHGQVRTYISGRARSRSLNPDLIVGFERTQEMLTTVVLSPSDLFTDFRDIGSTILTGAPGIANPIAGIVSLASDILKRTSWGSEKFFNIPYIDFREECGDASSPGFAQEDTEPEEVPPLVCERALAGSINFDWEVSTAPNDEGYSVSGGAAAQVTARLTLDPEFDDEHFVDDGTSTFSVSMDYEEVYRGDDGCILRLQRTGSGGGGNVAVNGGHIEWSRGYGVTLLRVGLGEMAVTSVYRYEGGGNCPSDVFTDEEETYVVLSCPSYGFDTSGGGGDLEGRPGYDEAGDLTTLDLTCQSDSTAFGNRRERKTVAGVLTTGPTSCSPTSRAIWLQGPTC